MRGSPQSAYSATEAKGIIPAHAGLTERPKESLIVMGDHPRACGAHLPVARARYHLQGSSPRMRGSPARAHAARVHRGIIPAHAGLTLHVVVHASQDGDHPRACGAHAATWVDNILGAGSSPRMRGSPVTAGEVVVCIGIIPAHAGLTTTTMTATRSSRDHPRACGAHELACTLTYCLPGSSPRMRGSPSPTYSSPGKRWIIPAHAGLTGGYSSCSHAYGDHPRACGAHANTATSFSPGLGSSPRMRGSRRAKRRQRSGAGIIPAHAGLTAARNRRGPQDWDHPRACGAHPRHHQGFCREQGSSPRMRGSRHTIISWLAVAGIIPAHAGLT